MIYNKDLLKKAGITLPDQLTWAPDGSGSLLPTARKLTTDSAGRHPGQSGFDVDHITHWGMMAENHDQTQYVNWIPENGGSIMDKPFGRFTFNQPKAAAALTFQNDLINKWHVSPAPAAGSALDLFNRGQVAMYPAVNALLPYVVPKVNFDVGITQFPAGPAGSITNDNGLSFALNAKSKHADASWKLTTWLGGPTAQRIMSDGGYVWPAIKSEAAGYQSYWKAKGQDLTPYATAASGRTVSMPLTPVWGVATQKMQSKLELVFDGKAKLQPTLDSLCSELNQTITQDR
jgi:multiple sugar transport system substrate-binding protein